MSSPTISAPLRVPSIEENNALSLGQGRIELADISPVRNRAARGTIAGILLGTALWVAILFFFGVIKL